MQWLGDEAKGFRSVVGYVLLAGLIVSSIDQSVVAALTNWGILKESSGAKSFIEYLDGFAVADMLLLSPLLEEVALRFLPLAVVVAFISASPAVVFGANLCCAALFGAIHPYAMHHKVLAGVAGFVFGLVFLKCGGLNKRFLKASVAAVAAHGVSNLFVLLYAWWEYIAYGT